MRVTVGVCSLGGKTKKCFATWPLLTWTLARGRGRVDDYNTTKDDKSTKDGDYELYIHRSTQGQARAKAG